MKLSKRLAGLATKLVHERHQIEAKADAHKLRMTLEALLSRGIGENELYNALDHDHWERRMASFEDLFKTGTECRFDQK